jgi:hypothetical protein
MNHRSIGSIILLVLAAVNAEVERIKIKEPHKTTGIHAPSGAGSEARCDKDFAAGIQLAVVFMSDARRGVAQSEVMRRFRASSFFMKIGNVSQLSIIALRYQWGLAPRNLIRKFATWTIY